MLEKSKIYMIPYHNKTASTSLWKGLDKMLEGFIVRLESKKSFGFIRVDDKEYFFHRSAFNGHWSDLIHDFETNRKEKIKVTCVEEQSDKGLRVKNVSRVDFPNQSFGGLMDDVNED